RMKCDVLGLCETRLKEELNASSSSKIHEVGRWQRRETGAGIRTVRGIGFIICKEWADKVVSCHVTSSRTGGLNIQISGKATLKIIQTNAPTSTNDDDEIEEFYRELEAVLETAYSG
ncbi:hypothetical protein Tcan_01301, partial [Toxocara canis]